MKKHLGNGDALKHLKTFSYFLNIIHRLKNNCFAFVDVFIVLVHKKLFVFQLYIIKFFS